MSDSDRQSLQRSSRVPAGARLTIKDAIVLAYSNPAFMESLLADPGGWAEQFNLPPEAVKVLATLDPAAVRKMGATVRDPLTFAESTEVLAQAVRPHDVSGSARMAPSGGAAVAVYS